MAACAQSVVAVHTTARTAVRPLLLVLLAVGLPILAGLAWHQFSDNPAWPLMRSSMNLCTLREAPLSPVSPDGLYRVHVVQATFFDRFSETLVFVSEAQEPWPLTNADPNRSILEVAGLRSLDAVTWQSAQQSQAQVLQLWFAPGAASHQIHRINRTWRDIAIQTPTSQPAAGAERLDY